MHIIVDIRELHPLMRDTELIGEAWGQLYTSYFPHDTLTYLIFDSQIKKSDQYLVVPHGSGSWWRKRLIAHNHNHDIFRSVNFSIYAPYDKHIPTLTHISDHRSWLYPRENESGFFERKNIAYRFHRIYEQSKKVIVPNIEVGLESMELWGVQEKKLEVIPYFPLLKTLPTAKMPKTLHAGVQFFLYDGVIGPESKILDILKGYELYREAGGTNLLILHGYFSDELSNVIQIIRTLDLTEHVKIVGVLTREERCWLYQHAEAWIMLSSYYSGGPTLEMAHEAGLPLILSDIPIARIYSDIRIHPNHIIAELPKVLKKYEEKKERYKKPRDYTEKDVMQAYKNYLSDGF